MTKIVNRLPKFAKNAFATADIMLSAIGVDVLRLSKQQVPVKDGQLSSSGIISRQEFLKYRIVYNKKYASYQHRGRRKDGSRVVRNYTHPGRKKKYLSDPANMIWGNRKSYVQRYMGRVTT